MNEQYRKPADAQSHAKLLDRLAAVAGFADDLDVGLGLEQHAKAGPDQPFVVGQQDADAHGGPLGSGRRARTR